MGSVVNSVTGALGMGDVFKGSGGLGTGRAGLDAAQSQGLQTSTDIMNQLQQVQPQQQQFAHALAQGALGQGPSIADAQLQSAMSRNLQQQMAAAQANRAVNPALANRQLSNNAAQVQRDTANAGVTARLQEQQQKQQQFQGYLSSQQSAGANFLGAGSQAAAQNAQAQMGQQQLQNQQMGGLFNAGSSVLAMALAHGGQVPKADKVPKMADGGTYDTAQLQRFLNNGLISVPKADNSMGQAGSMFGSQLKELMQNYQGKQNVDSVIGNDKLVEPELGGASTVSGNPGVLVEPQLGAAAGPASMLGATAAFAQGGKVPGQAEVKGDSLKNDKVHVMLSPGEVVVPRSVVKLGKEASAEFVEEAAKKKGKFDAAAFAKELQSSYGTKMAKGGEVKAAEKAPTPDAGYGAVLAAHKELSARLQKLESKMGKEPKKDGKRG